METFAEKSQDNPAAPQTVVFNFISETEKKFIIHQVGTMSGRPLKSCTQRKSSTIWEATSSLSCKELDEKPVSSFVAVR